MNAKRYQTSEVAHVEIYGRLGKVVTRMRNLSATGAFLEFNSGDDIPQRGDLIKTTVFLESLGKTRTVDAEVVWSRGLGFGVCFLKKPELLARMFHKNTSEPGPQS